MKNARLLVVATCIALIGCGGDDSNDKEAAAPATTTPTTTATTTPTETTEAETGGDGSGTTEPGAQLKLGETAHVKYKTLDDDGPYDIDATAVKIEKRTLDDFKGVDLDPEQKKTTPYFVTLRITNTGEDIPLKEGAGDPDLGFDGIDDRGQEQGDVTFLGSFPPCEDNDAPKPFKKGKSYESCLVFLVPGGGSIEEVHWTGADDYVLKPVVWK
jgi:hypothetical protein